MIPGAGSKGQRLDPGKGCAEAGRCRPDGTPRPPVMACRSDFRLPKRPPVRSAGPRCVGGPSLMLCEHSTQPAREGSVFGFWFCFCFLDEARTVVKGSVAVIVGRIDVLYQLTVEKQPSQVDIAPQTCQMKHRLPATHYD